MVQDRNYSGCSASSSEEDCPPKRKKKPTMEMVKDKLRDEMRVSSKSRNVNDGAQASTSKGFFHAQASQKQLSEGSLTPHPKQVAHVGKELLWRPSREQAFHAVKKNVDKRAPEKEGSAKEPMPQNVEQEEETVFLTSINTPEDIAAEYVVSHESEDMVTEDDLEPQYPDSPRQRSPAVRSPSPLATPGFIMPTEETFVDQMNRFRATHEGMFQGQSQHNLLMEKVAKELETKNKQDKQTQKAMEEHTAAIVGAITSLTASVQGLATLVTVQNDLLREIATGVGRQEQGLNALAACVLSAMPKEPCATESSSSRCSSATLHDPPVQLPVPPCVPATQISPPRRVVVPTPRKSGRPKKNVTKEK